MAVALQVREITENDAADLVAGERLTVFPSIPAAAIAMAVGPEIERLTGQRPRLTFQMLDDRDGLIYILEDDFPGSGIYRVTVSP